MKKILKEHLLTNLPQLQGKKLLIAVSGGIDSVVITHLLHKLNYTISLAHCNFMLRGKESNKDAEFVIELAKKYNVPVYTIKFDTNKVAEERGISTQMAARDLRYNWFQKLCEEHLLDNIVTAHQKDDVLETFLLNLTRGTGLDGLTGIPEINMNIVRPLLPFTRNDILVYATRKKLLWREDSSNSSIKYHRNKVRHKVIPVLKEINPSLLDTFYVTLENLKGSQEIVADSIINLEKEIKEVKNNEIHFSIAKLMQFKNPKIYVYELFKDYGFTAWDDVVNLLQAQTGKQVFSKTHCLLKNRDYLILTKIEYITISNESFSISSEQTKLTSPISLSFEIITPVFNAKNNSSNVFEPFLFEQSNSVFIDYDLVKFPLTLRKWQKGDYFFPFGLGGKKKISKYFKDEKFSLVEKENIWLLCSNNDIIWVVAKRLDDRFKVTKATSKILKLNI
ncbi:tRNA lysidine(34) synthetase TilS [Lutibacter sp.]|uniref:tRNA lysidine(34) synthetase TilS n=1 Tax=Lutibacter sp. TaxID=1925666 RepID=UPI002736511A|nr:tRNA lysidine(34) synthetase TilS [Lutibacter sp.]MDP3312709.1 tRNA lysidine(34) synthetase TilS [Lutibacter sp.]